MGDTTGKLPIGWTTPGMLKDLMRPTLDAMLASVKFGPVVPIPATVTAPAAPTKSP